MNSIKEKNMKKASYFGDLLKAEKDSDNLELKQQARKRFNDIVDALNKATQQQFPDISAVQIFAGDNFAALGECASASVAYRTAFGAEYGLAQERLIAARRYQCLSRHSPDIEIDRFLQAFEPKRGIVAIVRLGFAAQQANSLLWLPSDLFLWLPSDSSEKLSEHINVFKDPSVLLSEMHVCSCSAFQDYRKGAVGW
jgi:hypothetical protein